jgi:hypothetical protein
MTKHVSLRLAFLIWVLGYALPVFAQSLNWVTVGGNPQRNGLTSVLGPTASTDERWRRSIYPNSVINMPIFTFGGRAVTSRYTSLNPLRAILCCFDIATGDTLWTRSYGQNAVALVMGFNSNQIYVRDFQQNGTDSIFAVSPANGAVIWRSRFTVERGILWTANFTSNGDLILQNTTSRLMRINHTTGDTVWTTRRQIPNTGAEITAVLGNTIYGYEGFITQAKRLVAIDAATGRVKYFSEALPGDGDQEQSLVIGTDSTVFVTRDGGNLHALRDNGTGFTELWSRVGWGDVGTLTQMATSQDTSLYVPFGTRLYRLHSRSGAMLDSSAVLTLNPRLQARMAIGRDGIVYVANSENTLSALTARLQPLWSRTTTSQNQAQPTLTDGGTLLFSSSGSEIFALRSARSNVSALPTSKPAAFALEQNYPNPFNPSTEIRYQVSGASEVRLEVFDMLGRKVSTLVNERQSTGAYQVNFKAASLASGLYFYRIDVRSSGSQAGSFVATKKMMLVK